VDFFARQESARRSTRWLLLAFLFALAVVVCAIAGVVWLAVSSNSHSQELASVAAVVAAMITLSVIGGASVYKSWTLRAGGAVVARSLGGRALTRFSGDLAERRLVNVVEEMAIAAGTTVPEIYVLDDEDGINAFAAGNSPEDAAIAVTRGALRRLNREELQGVVGHEFSHVLNGDMRLNTRLLGWIFGFLVIAMAMRLAFEILPRTGGGRSSEDRGKNPFAAVILVMLAVMLLGYIGVLVGRIFQSAVARHRERLADASSAQFTRNPQALANALLKIAGIDAGSNLRARERDGVAHMLFAPGLDSMFATHPPLVERIHALDPSFRPEQLEELAKAAARSAEINDDSLPDGTEARPTYRVRPGARMDEATMAAAAITPAHVVERVGTIGTEALQGAASMRADLEQTLRAATASPDKARAFVLAMLDSADVAPAVKARTAEIPSQERLAFLSLLIPTLRHLTHDERLELRRNVQVLALADSRITVFECCLSLLLDVGLDDLESTHAPHGSRALPDEATATHALLAIVAAAGDAAPARAEAAYRAAVDRLRPVALPAFRTIPAWQAPFVESLGRLTQLNAISKRALVQALATCVLHDGRVSVDESEMLRAVCAVLRCPMPALAAVARQA
jgi:Zn-dependent protease with chaperone function